MKLDTPAPLEKLAFFKKKLGMDNLFIPFFSSKPEETGFGLPIALLVAKKTLGIFSWSPYPMKGQGAS
jgi:hypothetical protein